MSLLFKKAKWPLIVVAALILAACLLRPAGKSLSVMQIKQHQSDTQLKGISELVLAYENEHEWVAPQHLSELVPSNRNDLLDIFYAPNRPESDRPVSWSTNKLMLDSYSDYVLALHANSSVVASEKSGLWPDGSVAVCFTNLTVKRMSISDYKSIFNSN